jgi:hypothetical protein
VHDLEVCSLNGVVGIKGIGNPMFTIVISIRAISTSSLMR